MTEIRPFPEPEKTDAYWDKVAAQMREQTKKRQQMKKALKSVMAPIMRRAGFTGACPKYRRLRPDRYDLFMFDFGRGYDCFTIQIGQCAPDDIGYFPKEKRPDFDKLVPLEKLNPEHLRLEQRARVQPGPGVQTADFFLYVDAKTPEDYKRIAESVVPFTEKAIAGFDDFARFALVEKLDRR